MFSRSARSARAEGTASVAPGPASIAASADPRSPLSAEAPPARPAGGSAASTRARGKSPIPGRCVSWSATSAQPRTYPSTTTVHVFVEIVATGSIAGFAPNAFGVSATSDARSASTYARRDRHGGCVERCSHKTRARSASSARESQGTNFGRSAGIWSAFRTVVTTVFRTEAFFFADTRSSPTSATATAGGNPCARATRSVSATSPEGSAGDGKSFPSFPFVPSSIAPLCSIASSVEGGATHGATTSRPSAALTVSSAASGASARARRKDSLCLCLGTSNVHGRSGASAMAFATRAGSSTPAASAKLVTNARMSTRSFSARSAMTFGALRDARLSSRISTRRASRICFARSARSALFPTPTPV